MELGWKRRVRAVRVASLGAAVERRENGVIYIRSPEPLGRYPVRVTDRLEWWAAEAPKRVFLARRRPDREWQTTTYADTLTRVRRLASGLLEHGLSSSRPLMILSGNSLEHGLLALAAMYVGIPYAPIAPAYSLAVREFSALADARARRRCSTTSIRRCRRICAASARNWDTDDGPDEYGAGAEFRDERDARP